MKTPHLPKGFLSQKGEPTQHAITMYQVYLESLPKDWNVKKLHQESVQAVRNYFGVKHGFSVMINWGLLHGCCKSKTSSGRHSSMSKALVLAQTLFGAGVRISKVRLAA